MVPRDSGSVFISPSQDLLASIQKSLTVSISIVPKASKRQCGLWKPGIPRTEELRCKVEMSVWCYCSTGLCAMRPGWVHRPPKERGTEPWKGRPSRLLTGGKKVLVVQVWWITCFPSVLLASVGPGSCWPFLLIVWLSKRD